jgi:beta-phosphoglucomutase
MKLHGVVFDFNGVLLWDTHLHEQAWQLFSKRLRGKAFTHEEMDLHVHGRNNLHTLTYLSGRELTPIELNSLIEQKEYTYHELAIAAGKNYCFSPGAVTLLEQLQYRNIPFTIATASPKINVDFYYNQLDLARWFDPIKLVFDDGSRPGKPDPALFLAAAEQINVPFHQCLLIEDSFSGLEAARRGGAGYIVALGPKQKQAKLSEAEGVHQVISQLDELDVEVLFG